MPIFRFLFGWSAGTVLCPGAVFNLKVITDASPDDTVIPETPHAG